MLVADLSDSVDGLGWSGILSVPVFLIAYLAVVYASARWAFGVTPGRGARLATALVVAAVLLGTGAIVRWAVIESEGAVPQWLAGVGWGAATGLAVGVWMLLMSIRRPDPAVESSPALLRGCDDADPGAAPARFRQPPARIRAPAESRPAAQRWFHATVVGFVAVGFFGVGVVAVVAALSETSPGGSTAFGVFGLIALVAGLGLGRLAWVLGRSR